MRQVLMTMLGAATLGLSGCLSLAPAPATPDAPVAGRWPTLADGGRDVFADNQALFTDARLRAVVDMALADSRELRVALLDVQRAQGLYRVERAARLPGVDASAGYSAQRVPESVSQTGAATVNRQYSVELGVSAWELDLFGRVRSLSEAALQQYFATRYTADATRLSVVAETANAWLTLAADRTSLALAEDTLANRERALQIAQGRFDAGIASALDVRQAEIAIATARADVAAYGTLVAQDRNALDLLVGRDVPQALLPEAGDLEAIGLPALPAGTPSELLLRRPDIAAAEASLRAAEANIGVARAAFFPRIALTGSVGTASASLDGLFGAGTGTWSFVPQLSLPIFAAGANRANLAVARADREIAVADYERSIRSAFREVADALAVQAGIGPRLAALRDQVAAAEASVTLSRARFERGVDNYLAVLDAQRTLYGAQQQLIDVQRTQQSARVTLFRALAGDWTQATATPVRDAVDE